MNIHHVFRVESRKLRLPLTVLGLAAATLLLTGVSRTPPAPCKPDDTSCAVIAVIDFVPTDGSYDIGRKPGGKLRYADVEHYRVQLQLDKPAPRSFSRNFRIMEVKSYWPDAKLGYFTASFAQGSRTPTVSYKRKCCGARSYPEGAPEVLSDGTFWLACTKKGKIKANGPVSDDGHARIRLQKVNKADGFPVAGKYSSIHAVRCP